MGKIEATTPTEPKKRRRRLDPEARRRHLLQVGRELFGRRPYSDIEVVEICKVAEISRPLFYHYFDSKEAFFVAVVQDGVEQLSEIIPLPNNGVPFSTFAADLRLYFTFVQEHPAISRMAMQYQVAGDKLYAIFEKHRRRTFGRVASTLPEDYLTADVRVAISSWVSFVETVALHLIDEPKVSIDQGIEMCADALVALVGGCLKRNRLPIPVIWQEFFKRQARG